MKERGCTGLTRLGKTSACPLRQEKLLVEFEGTDAVAVVAKRHGIGRDRPTRFWKEEFGDDEVRARGCRLQKVKAAEHGKKAEEVVS